MILCVDEYCVRMRESVGLKCGQMMGVRIKESRYITEIGRRIFLIYCTYIERKLDNLSLLLSGDTTNFPVAAND